MFSLYFLLYFKQLTGPQRSTVHFRVCEHARTCFPPFGVQTCICARARFLPRLYSFAFQRTGICTWMLSRSHTKLDGAISLVAAGLKLSRIESSCEQHSLPIATPTLTVISLSRLLLANY